MTFSGSPPFPAPAGVKVDIERDSKRTEKRRTIIQHRSTALGGVDVRNSIPLRRGREGSAGLEGEDGEGEGQHGGRTGEDVKDFRYTVNSLYRPARGILTVRTQKLGWRNRRGGA